MNRSTARSMSGQQGRAPSHNPAHTVAYYTPHTHASLARAVLYFACNDERLERRHRQGRVLAVVNFQRLANNLRLFVKTAKAEVCCEW